MRSALIATSLLTAAARGKADPTPSLAVEPAPAGDRGFAVERAATHGSLAPSVRVATDYASAPLVLKNRVEALDRVVTHQLWVYALASLSLAHQWVLHAAMPVVVAQDGDAPLLSGPTATRVSSGAALGDLRVGARFRFWESSDDAVMKTSLAIASSVWLPTASEGYTGDGAVRARGALHLEGTTTRVYWAANGGVRTRPFEKLQAILPVRVGTAVTLGLAAGFYADSHQKMALGIEVLSDLTLGGGSSLFDPRGTTGHSFVTAHFRPGSGPLELGAALGPGFGQGAGSADFRVLAMVGFAFEQAAPPSDEDGDGVPDRIDACLDLRGVPSADPVLNGCPATPTDRDGDGIPDENDACPAVAGESTRVKATHGCPLAPKPPDLPATKLAEKTIVLSQQVQFETGTAVLRAESDGVLSEVAKILVDHPDIELMEVQGHTDEVGTADYNRQLGQARATSVVSWLVQHGIKRERLVPKGYGSDRPIADNTSEEGRKKNRRVEFQVLRRKAQSSETEGRSP
jgi:outer membrane protein OmpA-like peptidoglycan-associated protein